MIWLFTASAALGLAIILELLLGYQLWWRIRKVVAVVCVPLFVGASAVLLAGYLSVATVGIAITSAYSIFNLLRIIRGLTDQGQLFRTANVTALWLAILQIALAGLAAFSWNWTISWAYYVFVLFIFQFAVALLLTISTRRQLQTTEPLADDAHDQKPVKAVPTKNLPSITVAVPARNEDAQLKACLDAILASDYPKLEVIVLDDHSADRTPEIIRNYAHDGVRFVRGAEPQPGWLPKNQAYDRLLQEASGKFILFCGVDVRLAPHSIRALEQAMFTKRKTMMTVLPENRILQHVPGIQAMRYYWEMAPPRRWFRRPPVLSSCWMIDKAELEQTGGFAAVKRSISPESHFAQAAIQHDGYSFVRSNDILGITSEKTAIDQRQTAIYTRYPQLHRRPELVMLLCLAELSLLAGPFIFINAYGFATIQHRIFTKSSFLNAFLMYPLAILTDIWLLNLSMYKYEFSEVRYKDRDVRFPIMNTIEVIPHLPKLK